MNAIPAPKLDPREQHFRIPGPRLGLQLFLRRLEPVRCRAHPVLYVHGGTFPSALSIAHRFDGYSWREPCARPSSTSGAWISTASDRPTATRRWTSPPRRTRPFAAPPTPSPSSRPPRPSSSRSQAGPRLSLIAHSWGTLPTGRFAGAYPDLVDRLVLFGPIARRPAASPTPAAPAWRVVTLADQWSRFVEDVPADEPAVLARAHFEEWGERYLDSDPGSRSRDPIGVKVPTGPFSDIRPAWHGEFPYDPALVRAPVAIIRGEWDGLIPDADARWLFDGFTASPDKRDIKIGHATHLMHLEAMRFALYRESVAFLLDGIQASAR